MDVTHIPYPVTMRVDYIRVYQPKNAKNIGCDPPDFPTAAYINKYVQPRLISGPYTDDVIRYIDAYSNWNYTTWVDGFNGTIPKSSYLGQC